MALDGVVIGHACNSHPMERNRVQHLRHRRHGNATPVRHHGRERMPRVGVKDRTACLNNPSFHPKD